jgi:splicing factor 3B subunit 2
MPPKDRPLTKNKKKRAKKKEAKALAKEAPAPAPPTKDSVADVVEEGAPPLPDEPEDEEGAAASTAAAGVKVDYVSAEVDLADPELAEFKSIFEKFLPAEELTAPPPPPEPSKGKKDKGGTNNESTSPAAGGTGGGDTATAGGAGSAGEMEEDEDGAGGGAAGGLGRKARKKANRLSVAELKQLVNRPDVVEAHDVTSADPRLLVHLKVGGLVKELGVGMLYICL